MNNEVTLNYSKMLQKLRNMNQNIKEIESEATKEASIPVKDAIKNEMKRSDIKDTKYVHMEDDIKISVFKYDKETGDTYREVKGGKKTHFKWKFREFGTSKQQGDMFRTKAIKKVRGISKNIILNQVKKAIKEIE